MGGGGRMQDAKPQPALRDWFHQWFMGGGGRMQDAKPQSSLRDWSPQILPMLPHRPLNCKLHLTQQACNKEGCFRLVPLFPMSPMTYCKMACPKYVVSVSKQDITQNTKKTKHLHTNSPMRLPNSPSPKGVGSGNASAHSVWGLI